MSQNITAANAGTITFGSLTVNRLGLGTNRIQDTQEGHELLQRAVELGVNFIDTAHTYAGGASEISIGNALSPYKSGVVVATKGGMGNGASPQQLKVELEESLHRLKTDCIDLYQLHRIDPTIPVIETMKVFNQFKKDGLIRDIGLSEVTIQELEDALSVSDIASVQNEYNIANRRHEDLVNHCAQQKIAFIPWFPLGGHAEDRQRVAKMVSAFTDGSSSSSSQFAIAWLLKRSPMMLPIPGTTSIDHLEQNLAAGTIQLSESVN